MQREVAAGIGRASLVQRVVRRRDWQSLPCVKGGARRAEGLTTPQSLRDSSPYTGEPWGNPSVSEADSSPYTGEPLVRRSTTLAQGSLWRGGHPCTGEPGAAKDFFQEEYFGHYTYHAGAK